MTHEQFMGLRVGDIVDYCGTKYEITKTYNNGFGIETNGFVVENKTANYSLTFRRRNGLWVVASGEFGYVVFDINKLNIFWTNNQEQNSIEHFKKKIEETKSELVRLETTLNGLQESKRMKELTETLSNLIVGDFYTIKFDNGNIMTAKYHAAYNPKLLLFYMFTNDKEAMTISNCLVDNIKQIIHRPNFSNEYRILLKKIDTFNKDLENA